MATPIQTDVVNFLTPIFIFIIVFVGSYALLNKTKVLGTNQGLQALAAFAASMFFILNPAGRALVVVGTPWLMFFGLLVVGIVAFLLFFGVKDKDIADVMGGPTMLTISISFFVILFLVVLSMVYGPIFMSDNSPTFWGAVKRTLYHPRVLGAIFLIVVASYIVRWVPLPGKK